MPMDFPAFPAVGQEYTVGTVTYVYNGTGWVVKGSSSDQFVVKSGDTMTGNLVINKSKPDITLNRTDALEANIRGMKGGLNRWAVVPGNNYAETGASVGSDFWIARFDDAGDYMGLPFTINRKTGDVAINAVGGASPSTNPTTGALTVSGGVGINGDLNVNGNINFKGVPAAPLDALAYNGMQVNGGCEVSQEFGTAAVPLVNTGAVTYISDMWQSVVAQASIVAEAQNVPVPFASQYVAAIPRCIQIKATTGGVISAAGDRIRFRNTIEGSRIARLGFGTVDAKPLTVAFWVFTTVPGTMSLAVRSNNQSGGFRSCVKNIVINAGNTWEYKVVTFPADNAVSNAWSIDNMPGIALQFCFGAGSTWQTPTTDVYVNADVMATPSTSTNFLATANNVVSVTGLCVLPGTQAPTAAQSPLIMRPYDQELVMCQRYYRQVLAEGAGIADTTTTRCNFAIRHAGMRNNPTAGLTLPLRITDAVSAGYTQSAIGVSILANGYDWGFYQFSNFTGLTSYRTYMFDTADVVEGRRLILDARL